MMVRLVKGAYWDTEVKRAQERGLADYPVFTRKAATDQSYLAARQAPPRRAAAPLSAVRHPQRADRRDDRRDGRRRTGLRVPAPARHGRGALRGGPRDDGVPCRIYAPVGGHRELLAYLVRRLLENGANSSFVAIAGDRSVPIETLLTRPAALLEDGAHVRHRAFRCRRTSTSRRGGIRRGSSSATRKELAALVCGGRCRPHDRRGKTARRRGQGGRRRAAGGQPGRRQDGGRKRRRDAGRRGR